MNNNSSLNLKNHVIYQKIQLFSRSSSVQTWNGSDDTIPSKFYNKSVLWALHFCKSIFVILLVIKTGPWPPALGLTPSSRKRCTMIKQIFGFWRPCFVGFRWESGHCFSRNLHHKSFLQFLHVLAVSNRRKRSLFDQNQIMILGDWQIFTKPLFLSRTNQQAWIWRREFSNATTHKTSRFSMIVA